MRNFLRVFLSRALRLFRSRPCLSAHRREAVKLGFCSPGGSPFLLHERNGDKEACLACPPEISR